MISRFPILSLFLVLAMAASSGAAEDYSQWFGHASFAVNTTSTGANVGETLTDFPILVRLGPADSAVFSQSNFKGDDVRFTTDGVQRLPHEIERWDVVNRRAEIWVRLDTVPGNAVSRRLRMHWGKPGAADSSSGAQVFDSASYIAVWHLGGANRTAVRPNSVAGGLPAIPTLPAGYVPVEGVVGLADTLRGSTSTTTAGKGSADHFNIGDGYARLGSKLTLSLWVKPLFLVGGAWYLYLHLGNAQEYVDNVWIGRQGGQPDLVAAVWAGGKGGNTLTTTSGVMLQNEWQYFVLTLNERQAAYYKNGTFLPTDSCLVLPRDTLRTENYLGRSPFKDDPNMAGSLDEVRIARAARSAGWVKLEHATQSRFGTPVVVRDPQYVAQVSRSPAEQTGLRLEARENALFFHSGHLGAAEVRLDLLDLKGRTIWTATAHFEDGSGRFPLPEGVAGLHHARLRVTAAGGAVRFLNRNVLLP